jgi:hypothetical protein
MKDENSAHGYSEGSEPILMHLKNGELVRESKNPQKEDTPQPEQSDKSMDIPRRIQLDRMTAAEKAIYDAQQFIERLPPDIGLTTAGIKLQEARELVADFVDRGFTKSQIKKGYIYRHSNGELVRVLGLNDSYIPIECEWISSGGAFHCVPGYLIEEVGPA